MSLLSLSGISKQGGNDFVLKDINFTQQKLQKIAIAGETGSGKSTLLKIIAGLLQPDAGAVFFENERVQGPEEKLIQGHPHIAYLSQHFELRNNYKVEEILAMANKVPDEDAETIYEVCRISHLLKRRTDQLSGGEKQRIATARLLIGLPRLLLLDEPYSNLDMIHKTILKSVIRDISDRLKITCLLISHDPLDILSWADEIIVIEGGQIIQQATPKQIYTQPVNEHVAGLFGRYNLISPVYAKASLELRGIKVDGERIFTRPENFKIVTEGNHDFLGKVNRVDFFGSHCEIEVLLKENSITVKTVETNVVKGDTIYLSLPDHNTWFLCNW